MMKMFNAALAFLAVTASAELSPEELGELQEYIDEQQAIKALDLRDCEEGKGELVDEPIAEFVRARLRIPKSG